MSHKEWAIVNKHGTVHRGPMTYEQARSWIDQWREMSVLNDFYHIASRAVEEWEIED